MVCGGGRDRQRPTHRTRSSLTMLRLLDTYASILKSWRLVRYEQEGDTYLLHLSVILQDDSRLEIRDYLFADGHRKYAYQWMNAAGDLRRRWDNAPHWPTVVTAPHHVHLSGQEMPESSTLTNLDDVLCFIQEWLKKSSVENATPALIPPPK